jgi:excisionase family DNA binding protein
MGEKITYDVSELASALGIGKSLAYELVHREGFPKIVVGNRRIVIPIAQLQKWLETNSL